MPYSPENDADVKQVKDKLSKTYASVSDTAARQAMHVFNSVLEDSGDEGKAWAAVYSKMNERGLKKKGSASPSALRVASRYRPAMFFPGQTEDDGWEPGQVAPAIEEGEGEGSQVPPARDSFGNQLSEN